MSSSSLRRRISVLLLALVLAAPWSLAAEPRFEQRGAAWNLFDRLWGALTSLWSEAGCTLDPSGKCLGGNVAPMGDNGCTLDPDGRCRSQG
ncbi:MAG TPA: hypothetical protein VN493_07255 [Thermoanaerobaculia bacterium]|nr:hypothetical protein [Thermoanaerobaculia bacterium]